MEHLLKLSFLIKIRMSEEIYLKNKPKPMIKKNIG
jgi:hypothetical protein